jgi:uncharacterized membrane protein
VAVGTRQPGESEQEARTHQPKRPVSPVAGPYGHPFHPILVTVPIGAWVASLVLDLGSRAADDPTGLARAAQWLVALGILGALAAALFGFLDLLTIPRGTAAFRTGLTHMALNLLVVGLFVVSLALRAGDAADRPVEGTSIAVSAVALAFLGVSGWLGGKLSYRYGVRVAEQADQADGFR